MTGGATFYLVLAVEKGVPLSRPYLGKQVVLAPHYSNFIDVAAAAA